jgi:excisionase family DNA binding protein
VSTNLATSLSELVSKLETLYDHPAALQVAKAAAEEAARAASEKAVKAVEERANSVLGPKWVGHDTFTVEEAGEILGLSRASAFAAAAKGELPTIRIGKRLIVPRAALERMLAGAA